MERIATDNHRECPRCGASDAHSLTIESMHADWRHASCKCGADWQEDRDGVIWDSVRGVIS